MGDGGRCSFCESYSLSLLLVSFAPPPTLFIPQEKSSSSESSSNSTYVSDLILTLPTPQTTLPTDIFPITPPTELALLPDHPTH